MIKFSAVVARKPNAPYLWLEGKQEASQCSALASHAESGKLSGMPFAHPAERGEVKRSQPFQ